MNEIELVSPPSVDVCLDRLRAATGRDGLPSGLGPRPVVGRSVRLRKRLWYTTDSQTYLIGTFDENDGAAVLRRRVGMRPPVYNFMVVWFAGVALIGTFLFVAAALGVFAGQGNLFGVVAPPAVPPLMLAFGVGLVKFARWAARDEEAFLVAFVAEAIGADRAPCPGPAAAPDRS